jgi:BCD family chlorophyll transporter-like MFS transporter
MIALMANTFLDLVAETTSEETRGKVMAITWTGQTAIIVVWAIVFRLMMPDYSPEAMQRLYAITPLVVMALGVLSVLGLERRLSPVELAAARSSAHTSANTTPVRESLALLRNPAARSFFLFVMLSFPAIFLQDALQEVFGGEVLRLSVGETTVFQQIFNGTVTVGMALTAALGARLLGRAGTTADLAMGDKKRLASIGGAATMLALGLQALAASLAAGWIFNLALGMLGLCVGVFTFSAITMMSDMTVAGQTGRYLGLWSLAQAVGLGFSFLAAGALHSLLIGSGLLSASGGYTVIFLIEAVSMLFCVLAVRGASAEALRAPARRATPARAV